MHAPFALVFGSSLRVFLRVAAQIKPSMSLEAWCAWFIATARLICEKTPADCAAIFYQTDIKVDGRLIDKGSLVTQGALQAGGMQTVVRC